jgi:RNA polymerase sigma-70 factor (ECF subfamily)
MIRLARPLAGPAAGQGAAAGSQPDQPSHESGPAGSGPAGSGPAGSGPAGPEAPADDARLVALSLQQPEHFGDLYDRYFAEIYRYAASRLGPDIADDLAAETFLAAFRSRRRFDVAQGSARSWLYGIATNMIGRHRRAEARRYRALARTPHGGPEYGEEDRIAEQVSARQLRPALMQALAGLPAGDRDVLLLTSVGGLSYDEVATALAIAPGTVGSRLNRARRKVRAALAISDPAGDPQTLSAP